MLQTPTVDIVRVPPHWVCEVWPLVQRAYRKVQRTALGDTLDEVAILRDLCEGSKELLIAKHGEVLGGVIMMVVQRPRGKCCIVVASLFNEFHRGFPQWSRQMNKHIAEYAEQRGCYTVEAYARDGVIQELQRMGWRRKATVMEMKLWADSQIQ